MKQIAVFVCVAICLAASSASAEGLRNPGFDSDLTYWFTCYENDNSGTLTPGTATWDATYGGSARLDVDGAPGVIGMCAPTCSTMYAGDSVWLDVHTSDMGNFAGFHLALGDVWGNGQVTDLQGPAGDYHMAIMANKTYPQGTIVYFWLATWPGAATCWVIGGHASSILEREAGTLPAVRPAMEVNPNPATGRTKISFNTPQSCRARLAVYDAAGSLVKEIEEKRYGAGQHSAFWNGRGENGHAVSLGTYFIKLATEDGRCETTSVVVTR